MKTSVVKNTTYYLTILIILCILLIPLAACTSGSTNATQTANTAANAEMPLASQLALGIIKLDETSYPVDQAQAAELLPLWKALRSLSSSDTAAPAEIEALVKQIQNTLTSEQVKAIEAMKLTSADIAAVMQERGMGPGSANGTASPEMQATRQARRESSGGGFQGGGGPPDGGGFPGGGMPPGAGDGLPEGGMRPQITGTPRAFRQNTSGINIFLVNLVIQFLETK